MKIPEVFKKEKKEKEKKKEKTPKKKTVSSKQIKKKKYAQAHRILKEPHISEKSTRLGSQNQYTFKVWPQSNKSEIKKAVEKIWGVDVEKVRIVNIPSKKRRLGRTEGRRPGFKKAIVTLKEGQKIDVLPR